MRKIIIAGLAMLTTLGAVLAAVLGSPASPVKAATAATVSAATTAGTSTGKSTLLLGLNGVSCVSAKFCAAVGSQGDSAHLARGDVPLTMIWNGAHWRKTAVPLPKGWPQGELNSVSCTSATYCVAFGDSDRGFISAPLAETWNGRAWSAVALPRPAGIYGRWGAVSCGAARNCVAVASYWTGSAGGVAHPFVVTLSGTKWTVRHVALPNGSTGGGFTAVSCVSAAYCVLAGGYRARHSSLLFDSWNGKAFTPMKMASPAGSVPNITGVSCASANNCTAIGTTAKNGLFNVESVAVLWNGRVWSVVNVPGRKGVFDDLVGVSCASATSCVAAGVASTDGSEQTSHALAASYDGRFWATTSVPALAHGGTSAFNAVSCPSAKNCVAVGEGGGPGGTLFSSTALTGFWNGKSWKLVGAS